MLELQTFTTVLSSSRYFEIYYELLETIGAFTAPLTPMVYCSYLADFGTHYNISLPPPAVVTIICYSALSSRKSAWHLSSCVWLMSLSIIWVSSVVDKQVGIGARPSPYFFLPNRNQERHLESWEAPLSSQPRFLKDSRHWLPRAGNAQLSLWTRGHLSVEPFSNQWGKL